MNNRLLKVIIFGIIIYYLYQKNNKLESETETFEKKINTDNDTDTMENVLLNQPTPQKSNDLIKRMTLKKASENSEFIYDIYDKMQGVIYHGITDDELDRIQGKLYVEEIENTEPIFHEPVYSSFDKNYYNPSKELYNNSLNNVQPHNILSERTVHFLNNKDFGPLNEQIN